VILRKHEHILDVQVWVVNVLDIEISDVQSPLGWGKYRPAK